MHGRTVGTAAKLTAVLAASGILMAAGAATASAKSSREHFEYSGLITGQFYGTVECHGVFIVNKNNPGGKEIEHCESKSPSGTLEGLKAGEEGSGATGGFPYPGYPLWESDDPAHVGLVTGDFTYKVNKKDTKFKLVAIY